MFLSDKLNIGTEREYTDEGFLKVPARISRIGIQSYLAGELGVTDREPSDIVRVYRPEEEVFSDASLSSFANKPITHNHPPELVNSKNFRQYAVGFSGPQVLRDGMFAKTLLHITDEEAIKNINDGKVELSNGYTSEIEWTSGVSKDGEQYDAIQKNIKGNHIAIVERGRAGPDCRVADNLTTGDKINMSKITIDGVDFEVPEQAAQAVAKIQSSLKDAEEELSAKEKELKAKEDEMEEEAEKAKKTEESLKAQVDDAKAKIPTSAMLDSLVNERTKLIDAVRKVAPEIKWEGKDANDLRKEVVALKCTNVDMNTVSVDYVKARFDMLFESTGANTQQLDTALTHTLLNQNTEVKDCRPPHVIAREKMIIDSRDAWKPKGDK